VGRSRRPASRRAHEGVFDTFIGEMFFLDEPVAAPAAELLEAA
jgi:hypothetical protein